MEIVSFLVSSKVEFADLIKIDPLYNNLELQNITGLQITAFKNIP